MEKSLFLYLGPQSQAYRALKDIEMRYPNIEKGRVWQSCISTTESLLFIPPNPISDELSSNKSPPPSVLAILKSDLMANINIPIQHRSEGSPELSKAKL